jgi:hypothetical protein
LQWSAAQVAYSLIQPKSQIPNIRHDGTLSIGNFMLMMTFLTFFSRKIQDFLEENLEFSKSEKVLNRDSQNASFTQF